MFTVIISGCSKEAEGVWIILVLAFIAFNIFVVYFIFKALEFVVKAINMYKSIIEREDVIIRRQEQILRVLLESKDNKNYTQEMVKEYFK